MHCCTNHCVTFSFCPQVTSYCLPLFSNYLYSTLSKWTMDCFRQTCAMCDWLMSSTLERSCPCYYWKYFATGDVRMRECFTCTPSLALSLATVISAPYYWTLLALLSLEQSVLGADSGCLCFCYGGCFST